MLQAEMYKNLFALTKRDKLDESYHAAFYLLSTDEKLYKKALAHVDSDGIDFTAIRRDCIEMGEQRRHVLDIAHNLFSWHSQSTVTPFDLSRLGYPLLDDVCNAMHIANGAVSVRIRENAAGVLELVLDDTKRKEIIRMNQSISSLSDWLAGLDENEEGDREIG